MGFTEVLTIIFVVLKVLGVVSWSWLVVFSPELIALAIYLFVWILVAIRHVKLTREIKKEFDPWDF